MIFVIASFSRSTKNTKQVTALEYVFANPKTDATLTTQMQAFNKAMSKVRKSVERLFGDIVEYFKFMDFKKNDMM